MRKRLALVSLVLVGFLLFSLSSEVNAYTELANSHRANNVNTDDMIWQRQFPLRYYATQFYEQTEALSVLGAWRIDKDKEYFRHDVAWADYELLLPLAYQGATTFNVTWVVNITHNTPDSTYYYDTLLTIYGSDGYYSGWKASLIAFINFYTYSSGYQAISCLLFRGTTTKDIGSSVISFNKTKLVVNFYLNTTISIVRVLRYSNMSLMVTRTTDISTFKIGSAHSIGWRIEKFDPNVNKKIWHEIFTIEPVNLLTTKSLRTGWGNTGGYTPPRIWYETPNAVQLQFYPSLSSTGYYRMWQNSTFVNGMYLLARLQTIIPDFLNTGTVKEYNATMFSDIGKKMCMIIIRVYCAYASPYQQGYSYYIYNEQGVLVNSKAFVVTFTGNQGNDSVAIELKLYRNPVMPTSQFQIDYVSWLTVQDITTGESAKKLGDGTFSVNQTNHISTFYEFKANQVVVSVGSIMVFWFKRGMSQDVEHLDASADIKGIQTFSGLPEVITGTDILKKAIDNVGNFLTNGLSIFAIALTSIALITTPIIAGITGVVTAITGIINWFAVNGANLANGIGNFVGLFVSGIIDLVNWCIANLPSIFTSVTDFFASIFTSLPSIVASAVSLIGTVVGLFTSAVTYIATYAPTLLNYVATGFAIYILLCISKAVQTGELSDAFAWIKPLYFGFDILWQVVATVIRTVIHLFQTIVNIV